MAGEFGKANGVPRPKLCQVALSVVDLPAAERWFREGFELRPAGGSRLPLRGRMFAAGTGLPRAAATCWWLIDRNNFFQLELFQFERPLARLMPRDARACDIGYRRMGIWVLDFDQTLARLERLGSRPVGDVLGAAGARRACVRSPDGVFVEIMEDDPLLGSGQDSSRATCPAAVRSVTMCVEDLEESEAFLSAGLGLEVSDAPLRSPRHEALWGLLGAQTRSSVFNGGSVLLEVVQYLEPVGRSRPADYRISDQGILNIAVRGLPARRDNDELLSRARQAGGRLNSKPTRLPGAGGAYVNDPQQFSIEVMWVSAAMAKRLGFAPRPLDKRPQADTRTVQDTVRISAPLDVTWEAVTDEERVSDWSGSKVRRIRAGDSEPNGRGSERVVTLAGGAKVTEQVIAFEPTTLYRYRVTHGGPFICHQAEVTLRPHGDQSELTWTMRFRPRVPGTGHVLASIVSRQLSRSLRSSLRPYVEARNRTA